MKLFPSALIGAVVICILFSCNKKNDPPVKSLEELVKGKAWSGDIKYASDWANQPFYVEFNNSNNKFTWTEARGIYGGTYTLDETKRELKMTFDGSGSTVAITINKDETVLGINYGGSYGWMIENVEQNTSAGDILDNTSWQGIKLTDGYPPENDYSIKFNPGTTLTPKTSTSAPYARSGSFIKLTSGLYNIYLVVNKSNIKGIEIFNLNSKYVSKFDLKKQ